MDQNEAIHELVDQPAVDRDGEDLGRVADVFVDEESNAPKWVGLKVEGREFLTLAPVGASDLEARPFRLDVDRAHVLSAPTLSSEEKHISPEEETDIERHYREPLSTPDEVPSSSSNDESHSERQLATDGTFDDRPIGAGSQTPIEVIRSEEDLVVDTHIVGRERVRLIKRIVTEQVTRTIEVRHEELVIERETLATGGERGLGEPTGLDSSQAEGASAPSTRRERIADQLKERLPSLPAVALGKIGSGGGAFSGETTEITLMQEEVVVTKRTVPRERVRVRKEVVTEQREISETLRKEQVDIDDGSREQGTSEQLDSERDREDRPELFTDR
jgi:stress response protein YsnF